jgi:uncharacterized protein YxeA
MKNKSLSKILLILGIVILLLGGTLIYYYSITITKTTKTITITETKTITTTIFLDTDGDGIPNYKEREYGTDPNKPNYLLAYALKKLPENEALKFKNVENFNESSKGLVDLYSSLPENVKNSKDLNDLLSQILSDNIINELEKNLFYDKFVLPSLPLIFDLNWFPIKEKLDKIYDINVTFIAKDDDTPIAYAELRFVPIEYHYMIEKYGMRPEDYPKVFPPDNERIYVLTPVDGKFDNLEERFSVSINDIVGGREYKIVVLIRDLAGNERMTEIKTPYIRQFENIAKTDNIIVIADYYMWYGGPPSYAAWRDETGKKLHTYTAILGEYDSGDPIVISKHIDWATGHGIDAFSISWWTTGKDEKVNWYYEADNILRFLENPLSKDIKFLILYENNGRLRISNPNDPPSRWIQDLDDPFNRQRIITDLYFIASNYFQHPSYLKIRGKPAVKFDYTIPFRGDITGVFAEVRSNLQKKGTDIYLINDLMGRSTGPYDVNEYNVDESHFRKITEAFDCISGSNFPGAYDEVQKDIQFVEKIYKTWREYADLHKKDFIPLVWPGHKTLVRDPARLKGQIGLAEQFTTLNIFFVSSFNEFITGSHIEPSVEEGFLYLDSLKDS